MSGYPRSKLFVSYSKVDIGWRDRFVRHLRDNFTQDVLWVDRDSIAAGSNDGESIEEGVHRAKYAVLLLTPAYLDTDHFARAHELPMLLAEQDEGLTLLPVLVEQCAWDHVPQLKDIQLVGWPGDEWPPGEVSPRALKRAVAEAGSGLGTPQDRGAAQDRAVLEVCNTVSRIFGIERRLTEDQRSALPRQTEDAFRGHGLLIMEDQPLQRGGEFALVYRGRLDDDEVAVKVVPTDAWRQRVEQALSIATTAKQKLRNETFIRVEQVVNAAEVHAVAMEYVPSPTLDERLAGCPGRRLPPAKVVPLLRKLATAQSQAHDSDVQIGALSTKSVYVDDDGHVRLSPFRIEAHLARGLTLSTDQVVNWDVLTMLTPEVYEGHQPVSRRDIDAHGQYYLGLLGLELLLGRRPMEVTCFKDLADKSAFFDDPRAFFDGTDEGVDRWTDQCPALAFVLARMLARRPVDRLESAEEASDELRRIGKGRLPDALRRCLWDDHVDGLMGPDFAVRFYRRLFDLRKELREKFTKPDQATHLARAVRDLVEFRPEDREGQFLDHVDAHRHIDVTPEDAQAFRSAFVEEVIATGDRRSLSARTRGDAWNAVLQMGIDVMLRRMARSATAGG